MIPRYLRCFFPVCLQLAGGFGSLTRRNGFDYVMVLI
jgi:hypothetical protein